jgi:hypothetical protein
VARWHVDDKPPKVTAGHPVEGVGHDFVMAPMDERRPNLFDERQEIVLGVPALTRLLDLIQKVENLSLLIGRQRSDPAHNKGRVNLNWGILTGIEKGDPGGGPPSRL